MSGETSEKKYRPFFGNKRLKRAGVQIEFTEEQITEYKKCAADHHYFIEKYMKIVHVDRGFINFKPYKYQKKMLELIHKNRYFIGKLPRQSGKTTNIIGYCLWMTLFHDDYSIALLTHRQKTALELLSRYRRAYEALPKWLQQGIIEWNKGSVELENHSKIKADSTTSSGIRGETYNLILLDEFAHIQNHIAHDFFTSVVPTISSGQTTKLVIISTPNGMNHFYKLWKDAEEKLSHYVPFEIHWSETPGRDEKWKKEQVALYGQEHFEQEYGCSFIGSTHTLIDPTTLKNLSYSTPEQIRGKINIYELPEKDHLYLITVDTSLGIEEDANAFIVSDITEIPYKTVSTFQDNSTSPYIFPEIISNVAYSYNEAYVLVELNGNGDFVANSLHEDLEYPNVLPTSKKGRYGQVLGEGFGKNVRFGVQTTKPVKSRGCGILKDLIEMNKYITNDFNTISELMNFVQKGKSFQADEDHTDDLVMCLVLFSWATSQEYFKELTDLNIKKHILQAREESYEQDLVPFGVIDDGIEKEETFVDTDGQVWETVSEKDNPYWGLNEIDNIPMRF